jgi:hypothetical protein
MTVDLGEIRAPLHIFQLPLPIDYGACSNMATANSTGLSSRTQQTTRNTKPIANIIELSIYAILQIPSMKQRSTTLKQTLLPCDILILNPTNPLKQLNALLNSLSPDILREKCIHLTQSICKPTWSNTTAFEGDYRQWQ